MKLTNTVPDFLTHFEEGQAVTAQDILNGYHNLHSDLFALYFREYVRGEAQERLAEALPQYQGDLARIRSAAETAPAVLTSLLEKAEQRFGFVPETEFIMLVGVYASNAWVDRMSRIGLAVERAPGPETLPVLLGHELCHRYHFAFLAKAGYDWKRPISCGFWAYLEGIATHYSRLLCPEAPDAAIYCHDLSDPSAAWTAFAKRHERAIAEAFLPVLGSTDPEDTREWFKLSGGQRFGQNRLGYYLGARFIEDLAATRPTESIMTLVCDDPVEPLFEAWLRERASV